MYIIYLEIVPYTVGVLTLSDGVFSIRESVMHSDKGRPLLVLKPNIYVKVLQVLHEILVRISLDHLKSIHTIT